MFRKFVLILGFCASGSASGYESDVHYGMTLWLALKAGFNEREASTIATGNQRVDSGDMQYIDLALMHACLGKDDVGAKRAVAHHYPGGAPGGDAARRPALEMLKVAPDKSGFMLLKLGEALHVLQDSWSHQGPPETPLGGKTGIECDPARAQAHSKARGGAHSHRADLTRAWPAETLAAAKATYDVLTQYPAVAGVKRTARPWDEIRPALEGFFKAATKSEKRAWFERQGIKDVAFLEGISLPDGARPFELRWSGRRLPDVPSHQSRQHQVDAELLDFFHRFFERWLGARDFAAVAKEFGPAAAAQRADLAARLRLWRARDHGRVAELAHKTGALTDEERARVEKLSLMTYKSHLEAYFPLLPRIEGVSPLLPFYVAEIAKDRTAAAAVKFRHAPYDAIAVVAAKSGGRWRVQSIVSMVEH